MSFSDVNIPFSVNSSENDPIQEFFIPVLKESVKYDVAVGYFSTNWIRDAATGIAELAKNNGKIRWVISPQLSKEDWELLSSIKDMMQKKEKINSLVEITIDNLIEELETNTRNTIAWMVHDGIFDFRVAIPTNDLNGIYHAKIGVFEDELGNRIAFTGSYNMTSAANTNWETIDIFSSLEGNDRRINKKIEEFTKAWEGSDINLNTYPISDTSLKKFIKITEYTERPYLQSQENRRKKSPSIPKHFLNEDGKLRDHQEEAINNWLKKQGRGIFAMATGSGKTVTALSAITKVYKEIVSNKSSIIVIVTVPLKHLAEQWREESEEFGFEPVMCFSDYPSWPDTVFDTLNNLRLMQSNIGFLITVNATFFSDRFQDVLSKINTNFLLVADEMHNLGAEDARQKLPQSAQFRIGLSATPKRHMDEIGTKALYDYFGAEVIEYGIKQAIDDGTLTPYYYYPIVVEFTESEMVEYVDISNKITSIFLQKKDKGLEDNPFLELLLMKRSRLIAGAQNKLTVLRNKIADKKHDNHILIYAGATSQDNERQIEVILKLVGKELGMKARKFTSDESQVERKEIIRMFRNEELQVIVAIKCLDEGVDVPSTQTAFILASSTNPREFVQRRGRVLRKSPGKRYAYIYDFVVVPPGSMAERYKSESFSVERKLFRRELERINEFASVAENKGEALSVIHNIKKELNLLDI